MGIFSSRSGGKKSDPAELSMKAEGFLSSIEDLLYKEGNWKAALKMYRKNSLYDEIIGEGGPFEGRFFKIAFDLATRQRESQKLKVLQNPEEVRKVLAETRKITWDESLSSVDDLCGKTDFSTPGFIWLTHPSHEKKVDPLKRINAAYCLAAQPDVVLLFLDDGIPMVVKKSFLKEAAEETLDADLQIEDLGQDLTDFARKKNLGISNFWGR